MKLLVLCGGLGTRLKSEIGNVPKAMAPVGDQPFLKLQIENWLKQGLTDYCFLLGYGAKQISEFLLLEEASKKQRGVIVNYGFITENEPLGTGGSIASAIKILGLKHDFLVINADTWLDDGIQTIMKTDAPTIGLVSVDNTERFGLVKLDENYNVIGFEEKSPSSGSGLINAGISKLAPSTFSSWSGGAMSLEKDIFGNLVKKRLLKGVGLDANFIDIGVPYDYANFVKNMKRNKNV